MNPVNPCEKCGEPTFESLCDKCKLEKKHPSGARRLSNLAYLAYAAGKKGA